MATRKTTSANRKGKPADEKKGLFGRVLPSKKPDPKMLGTGGARRAAETLKSRQQKIDDALREAGASRKKRDNGRRKA